MVRAGEPGNQRRGVIPIALDYSLNQLGRDIKRLAAWSFEPSRRKWTSIALAVGIGAYVGSNWEINHTTNVGAVSMLGETRMINQTSRIGFDTFYICEPTTIAGVEDCEPFERDLGDSIASLLYKNGDDVLKGDLVRLGDFCEDAILDGYVTARDPKGTPIYTRAKPFNCDFQFKAKEMGHEIPYTPKVPAAPTGSG